MGGNAKYINRETGEVVGFAEKIDLKKIPRPVLVRKLIISMSNLDSLFEDKFGVSLWYDTKILLRNGEAFSGSSRFLFDQSISDEEFLRYKSTVGDIDITIPREQMGNLWEFLNQEENQKISPTVKYLGHKNSNSDPDVAARQHQINAVFEIKHEDYTVKIQIDFEASDYVDYKPTEWSLFSHGSDWNDIKNGFKGVAHKLTLMNLARSQSQLENVVIVTPTVAKKVSLLTKEIYERGKSVKASKAQKYINPTNLAFSVDKGMRWKFKPVFFNSGQQLVIDGKLAFVEKDTAKSTYIKDLSEQFKMFFNQKPTGNDLKDIGSFIGVVNLIKNYSTQESIENFFFKHLVKKSLWGKDRGLERNDPISDKEIKSAMVEYLYEQFPYLTAFKDEADKLSDEYYASYDYTDVRESVVEENSFSSIFEAVEKKY